MSYELVGILLTIVLQGLYVAYKMGKFEEKLNNLSIKQDKHNNFITRIYELERKLGIDEEKIDVANHRIFDLEKKEEK